MRKAADRPRPNARANMRKGYPIEIGTSILVLFDIDGTLLLSGGAGRDALRYSLQSVFDELGPFETYQFHGKTDPQIVLDLMGAAGWPEADVRARLPEFWPVYLRALETELTQRVERGLQMRLAGVEELLARLGSEPSVALGLLTGNLETAAALKLAAAGIGARFDVGAFGSDAEVRTEMARIVLERARTLPRLVADFKAVVVGDTPSDIEAAKAVSALSIAVATGRHSTGDLAASGADLVFDDLTDVEAVLASLLDSRGVPRTNGAPAAGTGAGEAGVDEGLAGRA